MHISITLLSYSMELICTSSTSHTTFTVYNVSTSCMLWPSWLRIWQRPVVRNTPNFLICSIYLRLWLRYNIAISFIQFKENKWHMAMRGLMKSIYLTILKFVQLLTGILYREYLCKFKQCQHVALKKLYIT